MTSQSVRPRSKTVKFGDVVRNTNLTERDPEGAGIERIVGLEHIEPENLHIRRWNTFDGSTSFSRKFVPGQTLFGKRRAYQRKVAFAEFEGICSGDILTFETIDSDVLLPELLPFICQTDAFFDHALGTSAGSLSPRTSWKALKDFEFPLPPIEEQRRIAEILWAADEDLTTKLCVLEQARRLYSVRVNDLAARLNPSDERESWSLIHLGDIFSHRTDKGHSDLETLSVTIDGKVVPRSSLKRNVEDRTGPEKCFKVVRGDIAYNTMRMWQGACGIATSTGVISPAYTVVYCNAEGQLPEFWFRLFRSNWMMKMFERFSTGIASDRWRLYFRDFAAIKLKSPSHSTQAKILLDLGRLEKSIESGEKMVQYSRSLLEMLVHKAVSGQDSV